MTYLDLADPAEDGALPEKTGRVILCGGEALLDPVRAEDVYKFVERLTAKYARPGGVKVVVQTTGAISSTSASLPHYWRDEAIATAPVADDEAITIPPVA
jgi:hypothetical protein